MNNEENLSSNNDISDLLDKPLQSFIINLFEDITERDKTTIQFNKKMIELKKKTIEEVEKEYKDTIKDRSKLVATNNDMIKQWSEKINELETNINDYTKVNKWLNTSIGLYEKEINKLKKS